MGSIQGAVIPPVIIILPVADYGQIKSIPVTGHRMRRAKMMSAIGTMIDSNEEDEIEKIVEQIDDPAGTFYRFSLPGSILRRKLL